MEEVIYYLELKNQFYEKFLAMTRKFIAQVENGVWDGLELFADNRERILNILRSYDHKIAVLFQALQSQGASMEPYRAQVRDLLEKRAVLGNKIIAQDLELIAKMEEARNETIRDLKKAVETSQAIGSFNPAAAPPKGTKATKDV